MAARPTPNPTFSFRLLPKIRDYRPRPLSSLSFGGLGCSPLGGWPEMVLTCTPVSGTIERATVREEPKASRVLPVALRRYVNQIKRQANEQ